MAAITLDGAAVNLGQVARLVVETHLAAPCAVLGSAHRAGDAWSFGWGAFGRLWTTPPLGKALPAPAVSVDSVFDLASVSKPITALTLARLERAGALRRDEPLVAFLPELEGSPSGDVSLDLLTAHRAGLEAHIEFFVKQAGAEQPRLETILPRAASARRAECAGAPPPDGFPVVYSDLGYILVGAAIERRLGMPLDALVEREVASPLGLLLGSARQLRAGPTAERHAFVPTEDVGWRGGVLEGVVHDENAWVIADGGSAGHAGMFGDVWSVVSLGMAVVDALDGRGDWLSAEEIAPLVRPRPGGTHTAGFDRRGEAPASGRHFGPRTFGHLGFTGTSLWIDPELRLVGVLLTNRVHPTRETTAIREARPAAYDALFDAVVGF
jgi:CubicO group peptidase (beta-lactamase class C family)